MEGAVERVGRLVSCVDAVLPVDVSAWSAGERLAFAAAVRCCALLEGMEELIRSGATEAVGGALRTCFETFLVGCWAHYSPEDAALALARSDFVWENVHRANAGLPRRPWVAGELGETEPEDHERLGPAEIKKSAAAAVRNAGEPDAFLHNGYRQIFGPESWLSTHATMKSIGGHLTEENGAVWIRTRSGPTQDDQTWRLPMALTMTLVLLSRVFEAHGLPTEVLDRLAD